VDTDLEVRATPSTAAFTQLMRKLIQTTAAQTSFHVVKHPSGILPILMATEALNHGDVMIWLRAGKN
jgi:hypothetical protein